VATEPESGVVISRLGVEVWLAPGDTESGGRRKAGSFDVWGAFLGLVSFLSWVGAWRVVRGEKGESEKIGWLRGTKKGNRAFRLSGRGGLVVVSSSRRDDNETAPSLNLPMSVCVVGGVVWGGWLVGDF